MFRSRIQLVLVVTFCTIHAVHSDTFLIFNSQKLNWDDAQTFCEHNGGNLASVHNGEQNEVIREIIEDSEDSVWIGGFQRSDVWVWIDGSQRGDYEFWGDGEPNGGNDNDLCLRYHFSSSYGNSPAWDDNSCETELKAICEVQRDFQVVLNYEFLSWGDASDACEDKGGELLSVHSNLENDHTRTIIKMNGLSTWIGGSGNGDDWEWSDGSSWDYEYWGDGEPNSSGDVCARYYTSSKYDLMWDDKSCSAKLQSACKLPIQYELSLYLDELDWVHAEVACVDLGGHLASIHNSDENFDARVLISEQVEIDSTWIGGVEYESDSWMWSDQSDWNYDFWGDGEPNSDGDIICVRYHDSEGYDDEIMWDDKDCDTRLQYICENEIDWYLMMNYDLLTWDDAEDFCKSHGGHLMSIHSAQVNEHVRSLVDQNGEKTWIGGNDISRARGDFAWSDGSEWNYEFWGDGEPNSKDDDDCVRFSSSTKYGDNPMWDDKDCMVELQSICKISGGMILGV